MRNAPLLTTLLLASLTAWSQQVAQTASQAGSLTATQLEAQAQTRSGAPTTPTLLKAPVVSEGCPIGLFAERRPVGNVGFASQAQARSHQTGIELTFKRSDTPGIVSASVTVHGGSSKPRITPAAAASSDEDITETFDLDRQPGTPVLSTTELWMKKLAYVRWIELTSLEYADGSAWRPSNSSRCNATPNGTLLIAAH